MHNLRRHHLNALRAAEAVGRLGSLQAAADELGVSAGAVSQHLIRLERQFGRDLFARTSRGLVQTPLGSRLLPRLTASFRMLDEAIGAAAPDSADALTISVAPVFASKWLVRRLASFREAHPEIPVRLDASVDIIDPDASDIDVAIRVGRGDWPGVRKELLLPQKVFPVCAPRLAERVAAPADLLRLPAVVDANSTIHWDVWLGRYGLSGRTFAATDTFTDASLALDAAIAGQGVMLAWQTLAHDALSAGLLVAPCPGRAETGNAYYLITSENRREPRKIAAFRTWLDQEIAITARAFPD